MGKGRAWTTHNAHLSHGAFGPPIEFGCQYSCFVSSVLQVFFYPLFFLLDRSGVVSFPLFLPLVWKWFSSWFFFGVITVYMQTHPSRQLTTSPSFSPPAQEFRTLALLTGAALDTCAMVDVHANSPWVSSVCATSASGRTHPC